MTWLFGVLDQFFTELIRYYFVTIMLYSAQRAAEIESLNAECEMHRSMLKGVEARAGGAGGLSRSEERVFERVGLYVARYNVLRETAVAISSGGRR
jgi:hypothetical protein